MYRLYIYCMLAIVSSGCSNTIKPENPIFGTWVMNIREGNATVGPSGITHIMLSVDSIQFQFNNTECKIIEKKIFNHNPDSIVIDSVKEIEQDYIYDYLHDTITYYSAGNIRSLYQFNKRNDTLYLNYSSGDTIKSILTPTSFISNGLKRKL